MNDAQASYSHVHSACIQLQLIFGSKCGC